MVRKSLVFLFALLLFTPNAFAQNKKKEGHSARFQWSLESGDALEVRWESLRYERDGEGARVEEKFDVTMRWRSAQRIRGSGRLDLVVENFVWSFEDEDILVDLNLDHSKDGPPQESWRQKKGSQASSTDLRKRAEAKLGKIKKALRLRYDVILKENGQFLICEKGKRGDDIPTAKLFESLYVPPPLPKHAVKKGTKWKAKKADLPSFLDSSEASVRDLKLKVSSLTPDRLSVGIRATKGYSYTVESFCSFDSDSLKISGGNTVVLKSHYDRRGFLSSSDSKYLGNRKCVAKSKKSRKVYRCSRKQISNLRVKLLPSTGR